MKSGRIIGVLGLIIYGILALDKFNIISMYEGIVGFSESLAPFYTAYYIVLESLMVVLILIFKFARNVLEKEQLKSIDIEKLEESIYKKSLIGRIISIATFILAISILEYTLPIVIIISYILLHYFKLEARKMIDKIKNTESEV